MATLFGHIAVLIGNREDVATKALHYILSRSSEARRFLQATMQAIDPSFPEIDAYEFQPGGRDGEGRPDMRGVTAQGTTHLLIESKMWAGLTNHQPVTYLQRLGEPGLLLFIVPETNIQSLSQPLDARLGAAGVSDALWVDGSPTVVARWRQAGVGKVLAVTSWERLLDGLRDAISRGVRSEATVADVDQLRGFVDVACSAAEAFVPFLPEQVTSREIPQFLVSVKKVVARAITAAKKDLGFEPGRPTDTFDAYGTELHLNGIGFWFGYYRVAWRHFAVSPVWLEVGQDNRNSQAVREVLATIAGRRADVLEIPGVKNWYVPVPLSSQEPEDVVFEVLRAILERLRRGLAAL